MKIFLRCDERDVWFVNADGDKERLVTIAFFVEPLDDLAGIATVAMLRVVQTAWPVTGGLLAERLCEQT